MLIADDTTLDKPYVRKIELVHRHWSGKHHRFVSGINLLTLLWSDGTDGNCQVNPDGTGNRHSRNVRSAKLAHACT
jgi:hypothetical protein